MPTSSPVRPRHHVRYFQFGAFESGRLEVLGQHTARYVEGDHDLHAAVLDDLHVAAPLRTGESKDDEETMPTNHRINLRRRIPLLTDVLSRSIRSGSPMRRTEASRLGEGPPHEDNQRRKRYQGIQILWRSECHLTVSF